MSNTFNKQRRGGVRRKKVCQFCADKDKKIDYKDVETLKKFTTERGKILPRRVTGPLFFYCQQAVSISRNTKTGARKAATEI